MADKCLLSRLAVGSTVTSCSSLRLPLPFWSCKHQQIRRAGGKSKLQLKGQRRLT